MGLSAEHACEACYEHVCGRVARQQGAEHAQKDH